MKDYFINLLHSAGIPAVEACSALGPTPAEAQAAETVWLNAAGEARKSIPSPCCRLVVYRFAS